MKADPNLRSISWRASTALAWCSLGGTRFCTLLRMSRGISAENLARRIRMLRFRRLHTLRDSG